MDCLSIFNPLRLLISSFIIFIFFSLTLSTSFFFFFFFLFLYFLPPLFSPPLFCRYGYKGGFNYFILLLYPSAPTFLSILGTVDFKMSWVLKRSCSLWVALWKLAFNGHGMMAYLKHDGHGTNLTFFPLSQAWFTAVGLRCCSYYSTYCISRQFGESQGAPNDEGAFHTVVFSNRILGRISEAWPHHKVTKDIVPPKYIYPTTSYKQWLNDDIKWILKNEKAHMKTSKKIRRTEWSPWHAPRFTFLYFYDSPIFVFEFNKRLECCKSPMKANLLSFNFSNERISLFIIFAYCYLLYSFFSFLFFFLCHAIFTHDVLWGIFAMPMVFSPSFFLDLPFGFSI